MDFQHHASDEGRRKRTTVRDIKAGCTPLKHGVRLMTGCRDGVPLEQSKEESDGHELGPGRTRRVTTDDRSLSQTYQNSSRRWTLGQEEINRHTQRVTKHPRNLATRTRWSNQLTGA